MFKGFKLRWLALKIEVEWVFITRMRKKGVRMINEGVPLSSPVLFSLGNRIAIHGRQAMAAQKQYQDLCGITNLLVQHIILEPNG